MSKHIITDDDLLELQDYLKGLDSSKADYLYDKLDRARNATFERTNESPVPPDNLKILFSLSECIGNGLITMEQLSEYDKNLIQIVHNLSADFNNILKEENQSKSDIEIEVLRRGIKVIYITPHIDDLKGIKHIVFITNNDAIKTKGYEQKTTLFIVSENYSKSKEVFDKTVIFLKGKRNTKINKTNIKIELIEKFIIKKEEEECECCGSIIIKEYRYNNTVELEDIKELVRCTFSDEEPDYVLLETDELIFKDDVSEELKSLFIKYKESYGSDNTREYYFKIADFLSIVPITLNIKELEPILDKAEAHNTNILLSIMDEHGVDADEALKIKEKNEKEN